MPVIKRVTLHVQRNCSRCTKPIEAGEVAVKDRKAKHKTGETKYYHTSCVPR